MPLTIEKKKQYKAIAHHLKPVVTIAGNGVSEGVLTELERALSDHELIKVKIPAGDKEGRHSVADELASLTRAEVVQVIGRIVILYRRNRQPNPKLSNILRAQAGR